MPEHPDKGTKHKSRWVELVKKYGEPLVMPECAVLYLVDYLFEIGPIQHDGMGTHPLTHCEIDAWMRNSGIELVSWDARMLHRLSMEYLSESQRATSPHASPPWADCPYGRPDTVTMAQRLQRHIERLAK